MTMPRQPGQLRVRLRFGPHQIADYVPGAEAALAHRYAASIRRRFGGLTATVENLADKEMKPASEAAAPSAAQGQETSFPTKPLPSELLWDLTPT